jgi:hypothetical protein
MYNQLFHHLILAVTMLLKLNLDLLHLLEDQLLHLVDDLLFLILLLATMEIHQRDS